MAHCQESLTASHRLTTEQTGPRCRRQQRPLLGVPCMQGPALPGNCLDHDAGASMAPYLRSPTCKAQLDQGATWPTRQEEAWPLAGSILPTRHRFIREQPGQRGGRQQDARLGAALPAKHGLTRESAVPQGRKHHAGWEQPCLQDPA